MAHKHSFNTRPRKRRRQQRAAERLETYVKKLSKAKDANSNVKFEIAKTDLANLYKKL